jgi:hypothetical protein
MKIRILSVALLALGTAFAAETAPLQLKGVLNTGKDKLFGLSTETGDANAWVALGKGFQGYVLKSYDEGKSLLMLERDGKAYQVALASEKIGAAELAKGTPATVAEAAKVIDQMRFDEMMEKVLAAQKKAMTGMSQQMAKQAGGNVDPKDMEDYMNKVMDVMTQAMNIPQLKKDMAQIYAETFTKEELAAISDFNATPAGQAMIDKQPTVQEKMQAIMMPRMMAVGPKLQQLGMEFGKQQKAKAEAAKAAATPVAPSSAVTPISTQ